jgi:hypothetical protein
MLEERGQLVNCDLNTSENKKTRKTTSGGQHPEDEDNIRMTMTTKMLRKI